MSMATKHQKENEELIKEKILEKQPESKETKELLCWESAARPFKKRNQRFYLNLGLMLFIIAIIAIFLQEFFAVAALIAIFFYFYAAGTVEPVKLEHRITNRGVTTAEHTYEWEDLVDFWFTEKYEETILNISTKKKFPTRLTILLPYKDKEKVRKTLVEHLEYQETPKVVWTDNLIEWFNSKLPISMR
jgi:hypothetical protein